MQFLAYYPARTVGGRPWSACGTQSGLLNFVAAVRALDPKNPDVSDSAVGLALGEVPFARVTGYGSICNEPVTQSETISILGKQFAINRPDPRVWNATSKTFDHTVDIGPVGPISASSEPPPPPTPPTAAPDMTRVIDTAVAASVGALVLIAVVVFLVFRWRNTRSKGLANSPSTASEGAPGAAVVHA
jgi:hypothetical protein